MPINFLSGISLEFYIFTPPNDVKMQMQMQLRSKPRVSLEFMTGLPLFAFSAPVVVVGGWGYRQTSETSWRKYAVRHGKQHNLSRNIELLHRNQMLLLCESFFIRS